MNFRSYAAAKLKPERAPVVLAGPNGTGKSSLLNVLCRNRRLARVSRTPGKTQTINYFEVGGTCYFVDLPGYGYAKVPGREQAKWQPMIEGYLTRRDGLRLLIVLVDGEIGPTRLDLADRRLSGDHRRHARAGRRPPDGRLHGQVPVGGDRVRAARRTR